jgi:hypothetical protein
MFPTDTSGSHGGGGGCGGGGKFISFHISIRYLKNMITKSQTEVSLNIFYWNDR